MLEGVGLPGDIICTWNTWNAEVLLVVFVDFMIHYWANVLFILKVTGQCYPKGKMVLKCDLRDYSFHTASLICLSFHPMEKLWWIRLSEFRMTVWEEKLRSFYSLLNDQNFLTQFCTSSTQPHFFLFFNVVIKQQFLQSYNIKSQETLE